MASRRNFLQHGLGIAALGAISCPLVGCAARPPAAVASAASVATPQAVAFAPKHPSIFVPEQKFDLGPPPDIFDAQALDPEFWLKPRMLDVTRPASREKAKLLYWKDGEMVDSAYQELCHLLRDVNGKETTAIDPKLLETLWGTQAFVARYGIDNPLEILSGYRSPASNARLIEAGVPAARQSLHIKGRAADIRIVNLNAEVLGSLVRSFGQGGVGFYYRPGARGGWIHVDTGLNRTWKG
jgi:uncharacterized protein YcbK (DUF882 family)